jgi:hypothetical protein
MSLKVVSRIAHLDKSNVCCLFSEALTADVETIFSDETGFVGADAAVKVEC